MPLVEEKVGNKNIFLNVIQRVTRRADTLIEEAGRQEMWLVEED